MWQLLNRLQRGSRFVLELANHSLEFGTGEPAHQAIRPGLENAIADWSLIF